MKLNKIFYTRWFRVLYNGIWKDNPVFSMMLGLCTALAVSNRVENAIAMGAGVTFVLFFTTIIISALRRFIPMRLRMITFMLTISSLVIIVDRYLAAYYPDISKSLGPYVGLIITNCIIMGRAEAFSIKNNIFHSLIDGVASGIGYSYSLIFIAVIREALGFGTIMGFRVMGEGWTNWVVMAMAPGAFFVFAIYLWITRILAGVYPEERGK